MESSSQKTKKSRGNRFLKKMIIIIPLIFLIVFVIPYDIPYSELLSQPINDLIYCAWMTAFWALGNILNSIGKLVTCLLSGYKTMIFRAGPISLVRKNGKLTKDKFSIFSVLGRCEMLPKSAEKYADGSYFWNYFGGALFDIIAAAVSLIVMVRSHNPVISWISGTAIVSFVIVLLDKLIPSDSDGRLNDGAMLKTLMADPQARVVDGKMNYFAGLKADGIDVSDIHYEQLLWAADVNGAWPYCDVAAIKVALFFKRGHYDEVEKMASALIGNENFTKNSAYNLVVRCDLAYCMIMSGEFSRIHLITPPETVKVLNYCMDLSGEARLFLYAYYLLYMHDSVKAEEIYSKTVEHENWCNSRAQYDRIILLMNAVKAAANGQQAESIQEEKK